jgi:positive regulator of sigma E activity
MLFLVPVGIIISIIAIVAIGAFILIDAYNRLVAQRNRYQNAALLD